MITVAICDDEQKFRKNIRECCHAYLGEKGIEYELQEYRSGEDFLTGEYPDILLLDVTMKRISGLIVRDILARSYAKTRILFVAENKNFISEAFGRNVYGFLQKPLRYERFVEKMDEVLCDIRHSQEYIYCKKGSDIECVHLKRVLYIESCGRYTHIYIQGEKEYYTSEKGIRIMRKMLEPFHCVQCNRMQLVNLRYVTKLQEKIELINGVCLLLTKCYEADFREKYDKWRGRI